MKPLTSFSMNFKTRWNTLSAIFLAVAFFLWVIEFAVISDASKAGTGALVFSFILPLFLIMAGLVLLRALRLRHPLIYAIWGTCLCLMVMCLNFGTGDVLRIILSIIWYLFCGALLVGTSLGYVPWNLPATSAFLIAFGFRFLMYSRGVSSLDDKMIEYATLSILASLFCLTRCLDEVIADT